MNETSEVCLKPRCEYAETVLGLQLNEQSLETRTLFSCLLPVTSPARELLACPISAGKVGLPHHGGV